jgi:hypothetical protein
LKETIMQNAYASLADLGYSQATTSDTLSDQARFAIDNIVGFPADIPAESKAELYKGYQRRYAERHPAVMYAVINGHYVKATPEHVANKAVEKIEVGIDYAFSYSSQEFGKLKSTEPARHEVVGQVRADVLDYCSNRLGDLKRAADKILNKGKKGTRATLDFVVSMEKIFSAQEKSVKVKEGKGDTTASVAKFRLAQKAFWTTYNK